MTLILFLDGGGGGDDHRVGRIVHTATMKTEVKLLLVIRTSCHFSFHFTAAHPVNFLIHFFFGWLPASFSFHTGQSLFLC